MRAQSLSHIRLLPPLYCSPPGSSVYGILQARILEWAARPSSRGIFPTQGSNSGSPHCRQTLSHLSHQGRAQGNLPTKGSSGALGPGLSRITEPNRLTDQRGKPTPREGRKAHRGGPAGAREAGAHTTLLDRTWVTSPRQRRYKEQLDSTRVEF